MTRSTTAPPMPMRSSGWSSTRRATLLRLLRTRARSSGGAAGPGTRASVWAPPSHEPSARGYDEPGPREGDRARREAVSGLDQRPQHVLQDAAVAVVVRLARGVDAEHRVERDDGAVLLRGGDGERPRRRALVERGHPHDVEGFR